ncbi:MAG TPA: nuclear transport factor 2 family protein [Rhodanobacteraceae bacterium]
MRRVRFLVAVAATLGIAAGGIASAAEPPAQQAIRPLMAKMLQAANAHDTDAFMASMQHVPGLVFAINGEVIHGWNALHTQQLKWWHDGRSTARYTEGRPEFMALGPDVEVLTWPLVSHGVTVAGKPTRTAFVVTYIWQRLPAGWRIVYGHESWAEPPA